ncbi:MAG: hypothetical protein IPJ17_06415 [Holophagales bacterium]|nr:MAG: hypothetical protein IPJ17_06415 [Holophagales bacterium]
MKKLVLCLALVSLVALGGQASAVIGTVDDVPAATLLLPYFEVDLANTNGLTTLFSVNNASATAVLAHVVVWSDLSVPVLDFNIYLTGYDVQTVNMRDIINGTLPRTASAGQDPGDTISPKGTFSQDINFASCTGQLPLGPLSATYIDHLKKSLTGQASSLLGGRCAGQVFGDNVARGYVTIDTVNNCTLRFPGDAGYFVAGGTGDATNQNVLWGDYFFVTPEENYASGETMVHIEASATNPETSVPGQYTFYGRYVTWTAADNREPLATNFATRYILGGAFSGGTDLIAWRDSKVNQGAFTCPATLNLRPSWYPLGQEQIVIFDEQEHPEVPQTTPVSPPLPNEGIIPFPAEAQRTAVDGEDFPVSFSFGWLFLDLNATVAAAGNNPPEDPLAAQAWVETIMSAEGRYSVGFDAIKLDSATAASHARIGN